MKVSTETLLQVTLMALNHSGLHRKLIWMLKSKNGGTINCEIVISLSTWH